MVGSSFVFLLRAEEVDEEDEPISEMVNLVHQPQVFLISIYNIEQCFGSVTNGSRSDSGSGSCYFLH